MSDYGIVRCWFTVKWIIPSFHRIRQHSAQIQVLGFSLTCALGGIRCGRERRLWMVDKRADVDWDNKKYERTVASFL